MLMLDDDILRQLRATFKIEAAEHIQAMNRVLLALEEQPTADERAKLMEEVFREAHSLKGAAGAADFGEVEALGHRLESVLGVIKAGKVPLTPECCDLLYESIDAVNVIIEAALEDRTHNLPLPDLFARLDTAKEGRLVARTQEAPAPPPASPAPSVAPATPVPQAVPTVRAEPAGTLQPPPPSQNIAETALDRVLQAQPVPPEPATLLDEPEAAPEKAPAEVLAVAPAKAGQPEEPKAKTKTHDIVPEETIRVATSKLDALMTQAGELLVAGLRIDQCLQAAEEISRTIEDWNREWLKIRATCSHLLHDGAHEEIRPLLKFVDLNQQKLKTVTTQAMDLRRGFARDALYLSRVTNDLNEGVMKVRMLPVATVFDAFPRMVRDLSKELGKEVDLQLVGSETELDRKVLEEIKDPLLHLLRNAIDHGIETPQERLKTGKPRRGTITLSAFQKGSNIVIEVADDGAGINVAKVKKAAVKAGLIRSDEAEAMKDEEAYRLIFAAGFSTKSVVTDISGRGVGMDVVRKNAESLHGQVDLESSLGQGTKFTLTLPLTLATTQELLVQVGEQTFGLPVSAVQRIQRIPPEDISMVEGRPAIVVDNSPVSLVHLADVLDLTRKEDEPKTDVKVPVVILGSAKRKIAIQVDAVVGQQESVVKNLGKQLARVRNIAGATILGTGQVIMTLNPVDLAKSARTRQGHKSIAARVDHVRAEEVKRPTVLVVDDSLTTRTLEKNILETAGYQVKVATDGLEALGILQSSECDVIVSDVLMPRMNGLQLTSAIKGDQKLKNIPIVLVTSLDSRADKERGIEVGADAYVIKSTFDQTNLLQTIEQLI